MSSFLFAAATGTLIWALVSVGHYAVAAGTATFTIVRLLYEIYTLRAGQAERGQ